MDFVELAPSPYWRNIVWGFLSASLWSGLQGRSKNCIRKAVNPIFPMQTEQAGSIKYVL